MRKMSTFLHSRRTTGHAFQFWCLFGSRYDYITLFFES